MTAPIALNIDAYGGYARTSALADYVEIATIDGVRVSRAELADRLGDVGARKLSDMVGWGQDQSAAPDDLAPVEDEQEEVSGTAEEPAVRFADRVFDMLREREEALGALYPFEVTDDRLVVRSVDLRASIYVAILCIALAHANSIPSGVDPKRALEATVARALKTAGFESVDVAAVSRTSPTFSDTVRVIGQSLGLRASPASALSYTNAKDEGVDCVAHLRCGTPRGAGAWTALGQVTCGKSETWAGKMDEPKPPLWLRLLGTGVSPLAFLAVPHHVDGEHLSKLIQDGDRLVLDRLRLVELGGQPSADEQTIASAVLQVGVERIA